MNVLLYLDSYLKCLQYLAKKTVLTLPINIKYENYKQNLSSNVFTLSPLGGGYDNGVIGKLVGELKIRLNSKDEPSIFKIECVMWLFVQQPEAKISIKQNFEVSKSQSVFEIWKSFLIEIFASGCITKSTITRSIFKIEGSSFGFSLIFMGFKNHVFQLKLSDHFFNDPIFYTPLPGGVG